MRKYISTVVARLYIRWLACHAGYEFSCSIVVHVYSHHRAPIFSPEFAASGAHFLPTSSRYSRCCYDLTLNTQIHESERFTIIAMCDSHEWIRAVCSWSQASARLWATLRCNERSVRMYRNDYSLQLDCGLPRIRGKFEEAEIRRLYRIITPCSLYI